MVNGVFDLLHPGHHHLLTEARKHGDALLVAINSDDSTRRLKRHGRPVVPEDVRAKSLADLRVVDRVVVFNEDTPERLILATKPNVLVKGAEYENQRVVGADLVSNRGGQIIYVPMLPGYSTTKFLEEAYVP